ncbi:MAG TPA: hypothetical protein PLF42_14485 [Anaerolineales bacterium]|nr:hypothetical protein [Anaerolineales bacterium]
MTEKQVSTEPHGCIVCGKLYQMLVVRDAQGKFADAKIMSAGGRVVNYAKRPLAACESHSDEAVEAAVQRAYGELDKEE